MGATSRKEVFRPRAEGPGDSGGFASLRNGQTGSRIRERRETLGLKQAALARTVGISASYLNLIEHNRRRIGGKLLVGIARALGVDVAALAEGAEAALLADLMEAAAAMPKASAEEDRCEEFVGRFPGWAALAAAQRRRIASLEREADALADRLSHDPSLSASLHDVLTAVASIRSASAILSDTADLGRAWRKRFVRNIREDSRRLSESAGSLVDYLDSGGARETGAASPQEELEEWLAARGHHLPPLEGATPMSADSLIGDAPELRTSHSRALAASYVARYRADAERMPLPEFRRASEDLGQDPARLSEAFGVDVAAVLRRLSCLPEEADAAPVGLAVCDGSGTLTFRKPTDGFALPRFGAGCPLWPLFRALSRPMTPIRAVVAQAGPRPARFLAYAVAQPSSPPDFDAPPVFESTMLLLPETRVRLPDERVEMMGAGCRVCPRSDCAARREPSVLAEEARTDAG